MFGYIQPDDTFETYVAREWPKLAFSEGHVGRVPSMDHGVAQREERHTMRLCYYRLMGALTGGGWINPFKLQQRTHLSGSLIRRSLEELGALGYVERRQDRTYKNRYAVRLTHEGRVMLSVMQERGVDHAEDDDSDDPGSDHPDRGGGVCAPGHGHPHQAALGGRA